MTLRKVFVHYRGKPEQFRYNLDSSRTFRNVLTTHDDVVDYVCTIFELDEASFDLQYQSPSTGALESVTNSRQLDRAVANAPDDLTLLVTPRSSWQRREPPAERLRLASERFAEHADTECHWCPAAPIVGPLHAFDYNSSYAACDKCATGDYSAYDYEVKLLPWKLTAAPKAPLRRDEYADPSDKVRHLQAWLYLAGFMKLQDTAVQTGVFGENTSAAVGRLRKELHITDGKPGEYTKGCQIALGAYVASLSF